MTQKKSTKMDQKEKTAPKINKADDDDEEDEVNLFDLDDESEIIFRKKIHVFEERIRVLEDLLETETDAATRAVLQRQVDRAREEMERVEEVQGEEVIGQQALNVLKAQIEEADRQNAAKDEL